jgi:hypothetical protein
VAGFDLSRRLGRGKELNDTRSFRRASFLWTRAAVGADSDRAIDNRRLGRKTVSAVSRAAARLILSRFATSPLAFLASSACFFSSTSRIFLGPRVRCSRRRQRHKANNLFRRGYFLPRHRGGCVTHHPGQSVTYQSGSYRSGPECCLIRPRASRTPAQLQSPA